MFAWVAEVLKMEFCIGRHERIELEVRALLLTCQKLLPDEGLFGF